MELLQAMNGINDKIDHYNHPSLNDDKENEKTSVESRGKTGVQEVDVLYKQLEALDSNEKKLQREIEAIEREFSHLTVKFKKSSVSSFSLSLGLSVDSGLGRSKTDLD